VSTDFVSTRHAPDLARLLVNVANSPGHGGVSEVRLKDIILRLTSLLQLQRTSPLCARDFCDVALSVGKLHYCDCCVTQLLEKVADLAKYRVGEFTPQDMADIMWGFASLGVKSEGLMSVVAAEVVSKIHEFDQRQLADTAWSFAKCGLWNAQLVSAIVSESTAKISTFTSSSLSKISWSMVQWGAQEVVLMDAIAAETKQKITDFAPDSLSLVAWSFGSLNLHRGSLMAAIASEAKSTISRFEAEDLSHLVFAFANSRDVDEELFSRVAESIVAKIKSAAPSDLSNIAWAFSRSACAHTEAMDAIVEESIVQLHRFKQQELVTLITALATAGLQNTPLMNDVGALVGKQMAEYHPVQLAHISWAFGALHVRHNEYFQALTDHMETARSNFRASELCNIVFAFALVSFRDEPLLLKVAPDIEQDMEELKPLTLGRCVWAYRVLHVPCDHLMKAGAGEALRRISEVPTKALVKLVDALSVCAFDEAFQLEKVLESRITEVAGNLREWCGRTSAATDVKDYAEKLRSLGVADCGIMGTSMLMRRLGIDLPSRGFVRLCQSKSLIDRVRETPRIVTGGKGSVRRDYTAAELDITALDQNVHDFVVRYKGDRKSSECGWLASWLVAVDLAGHHGIHETVFQSLLDFCGRLVDLGVTPDTCASVHGSLEMLSSVAPCLSSVGALHQFSVIFPGVMVRFIEMLTVRD